MNLVKSALVALSLIIAPIASAYDWDSLGLSAEEAAAAQAAVEQVQFQSQGGGGAAEPKERVCSTCLRSTGECLTIPSYNHDGKGFRCSKYMED